MNLIDQPPQGPRSSGARPDDLDELLHAFFQAEMPDPWPALEPPAMRVRPPDRWRSRWRSRFALAASVALLLTGSLVLSARLSAPDAANVEPGTGEIIGSRPGAHKKLPVPEPSKAAAIHPLPAHR